MRSAPTAVKTGGFGPVLDRACGRVYHACQTIDAGLGNSPRTKDSILEREFEMSPKPDRIEFEVPAGKLVVQHATCPAGCSLMDPKVKIHDHPSIHLAYTYGAIHGHIHLDPVYGSFDNVSDREIPRGTVVSFTCPSCGVSLTDLESTCSRCTAPMFMLNLPKGNFVEGCQRSGCFHHKLHIVTGEQLMQRMFDDLGMDSYL